MGEHGISCWLGPWAAALITDGCLKSRETKSISPQAGTEWQPPLQDTLPLGAASCIRAQHYPCWIKAMHCKEEGKNLFLETSADSQMISQILECSTGGIKISVPASPVRPNSSISTGSDIKPPVVSTHSSWCSSWQGGKGEPRVLSNRAIR